MWEMMKELAGWLLFIGLVTAALDVLGQRISKMLELHRKLKAKKYDAPTQRYPLVVGREYSIRRYGDWYTLVFMGRQADDRYEFRDLAKGVCLSLQSDDGSPDVVYQDKDIRWIPDDQQSPLQCPEIEKEV